MEYDIEKILQTYEDDYNPGPRPMNQGPRNMAQGGRIGLVEGGLLKTGPNTGKYVLRNQIDGERIRRFFDTEEEFDAAVKESQTKPKGGSRGDYTKRMSTPTTSELEIAENVYGKKYDKTGNELWQSLKGNERRGIKAKTTTGGKPGPKEGLAVNEEGKPNHAVKREKALKRNAPFFQKGTKDFQFHHIMNIGGEIPLDTNDIAVISGEMNRALAPDNRKLNNIADNISDLLNDQPENYLKKIDQLNSEGESIVKTAIKKLPKEYKNLIGFNKVVPITDEYGTLIDISSQKIGGSNQKKPGIKLENLTTQQASQLRKQIKTDSKMGKIQSKGIAKKLEASNFKCKLANGLTCNDPRAYTDSIKENMAKASQGDKKAVANIKKMGKLMNGFKGAAKFTGWGLLGEIGFAAPLAALDYAKGANTDEIISNASYGLFGKSQNEQLQKQYSDYGQAQNLKDTYDKLLKQENSLNDQTGYGSIPVNQQVIKDTENKFEEQSKEFAEVLPPSMGFKGEFDLDNFMRRREIDAQRDAEYAKQKQQRSDELGIIKPSTGLEAIGFNEGGLADLMKKYYD